MEVNLRHGEVVSMEVKRFSGHDERLVVTRRSYRDGCLMEMYSRARMRYLSGRQGENVCFGMLTPIHSHARHTLTPDDTWIDVNPVIWIAKKEKHDPG